MNRGFDHRSVYDAVREATREYRANQPPWVEVEAGIGICLCGRALYEHDLHKVKAPRAPVAGREPECEGFVLHEVEVKQCQRVRLSIPINS